MDIIKKPTNEQPRTGWYLHIQGNEEHQRFIEESNLQGIFICKYNGNWLIYLNEIQDEMMNEGTAEERLEVANETISSLNYLLSQVKVQEISESNQIGFIGSDGNLRMHVFLKTTVNVSCSVAIKVGKKNSNGEIDYYEIPSSKSKIKNSNLRYALTTPTRRRALRLMKSPGFSELYVVLEDAMAELDGFIGIKNAGISEDQIKRFKQTANSEAAGDSRRHGERKLARPPIQPMDLKDAIKMMNIIIDLNYGVYVHYSFRNLRVSKRSFIPSATTCSLRSFITFT